MNIKKIIAGIVTTALVGTTMAVSTMTTVSADTIGQAWIMMQQGTAVSNWKATDGAGSIDITGNGSYTISFDIPEDGAAEQIDFLGISTDINIYEQNADEVEMYKNMTFDIDSILVDGVEIAYNGPSASANGTNDDGSTYRLSIYDTWSSRNVQDIDNVVACTSNITINFTVNGIVGDSVAEETPEETEVSEEVSEDVTATEDVTTIANSDASVTTGLSLVDVTISSDSDVSGTDSSLVTSAAVVTTVVTVTDEEGNVVTDEEGNAVTSISEVTSTPDDDKKDDKEDDKKEDSKGSESSSNTDVTTTSADTTSPTTGDNGVGVAVVALAIAGISAATLNKRK